MRKILLSAFFFSLFMFAACDRENTPDYDIPSDYSGFSLVSYSGQTERLDMLEEMTTYMKTANTQGVVLDEAVLLALYENSGNTFSFTSEKQLKNKTFAAAQAQVEDRIAKIALASQSTQEGYNGIAGVVTSNDGANSYLFDENGFELTQLIEKGLMGSCFYYQATGVYLTDAKTADTEDNTNVDPIEGTALQHHYDEAFGYWGVPQDFPTNTEGIRFWGKYCNTTDEALSTNTRLMAAFCKGRAAIDNNDFTAKNEARDEIRAIWEEVAAGTAIHYIRAAKESITDDALRNHTLSEAFAFIEALRYNPVGSVDADLSNSWLSQLGSNFYEVSESQLDNLISEIANHMGFTDVQVAAL